MIRWHSSCYASYISKQNINARNSSSDAELCSSTPSTGTITASTTRSQCKLPDLRDLKHHCFFCGQKKNKGDTKLISIQYKSVSDELAKKCNEKRDIQPKNKIGGDFNNLLALDAKYHTNCMKTYMRVDRTAQSSSIYDKCFEKLMQQNEEYICSGRAVFLSSLLIDFKKILEEESNARYELYTTQNLRTRIQKHFGERVRFTEGHSKQPVQVYDSRVSIADTINTAVKYKQMIKDQELLSNHTTTASDMIRSVEK